MNFPHCDFFIHEHFYYLQMYTEGNFNSMILHRINITILMRSRMYPPTRYKGIAQFLAYITYYLEKMTIATAKRAVPPRPVRDRSCFVFLVIGHLVLITNWLEKC